MLRRILTTILLAALAGAIAGPPLAAAGGRCAMCAKACCCAPMKGIDRCRISRTCDSETSSEAASSPELALAPALLPNAITIPEASRSGDLHEIGWPLPLDPAQEPPDHPPRPSL